MMRWLGLVLYGRKEFSLFLSCLCNTCQFYSFIKQIERQDLENWYNFCACSVTRLCIFPAYVISGDHIYFLSCFHQLFNLDFLQWSVPHTFMEAVKMMVLFCCLLCPCLRMFNVTPPHYPFNVQLRWSTDHRPIIQ